MSSVCFRPRSASPWSWRQSAAHHPERPPEPWGMADASRSAYRERYATLRDRLAAPEAARELDALKIEIGTLFKHVEQELGELTALRDSIKRLVEQWKLVKGAAASAGGAASNGAGGNGAGASAIA